MPSFTAYPTTNRSIEWCEFSTYVMLHIEDYTVPQYGDAPNDAAEQMSAEEMLFQIGRYCLRHGRNARGKEEERRDLLKIAHYACMAYNKLKDLAELTDDSQS